MFEKIVVITRKTRLQELVARFNTRAQAKFYIEHAGGNFQEYADEDDEYASALNSIKRQLRSDLKLQYIDRSFLPTFVFCPTDLVVVVGQDGLVANAAKYVGVQPIIGINPDPARYDGLLVQNEVPSLGRCIDLAVADKAPIKEVTLAQVTLNDGQRMLAFNDFFIGARSHVSARYTLSYDHSSEHQSSSGIIVSTGAGSTGWLSSVFNMVGGIQSFTGGSSLPPRPMAWDDPYLMFVVREPFVSKHSSASIAAGVLEDSKELIVESQMTDVGAIFSDGIEQDFLPFNAGSIARIGLAPQKARVIIKR